MKQIYLDYNATTPVDAAVTAAILPFLTEHYGNPSSGHILGRTCAEAIAESREQIAAMLGCGPEEIIFTGCATESNNIAIRGLFSQMSAEHRHVGGHLIVSNIEHPAVAEPARHLQQLGFDLSVAQCDSQGIVAPEAVASLLRDDTRLVSIMHANNEIGTIQPIAEIARICREHQVLLHTDAAQSVGKVRVNVDELDVDLLTIAGHKIYAPKGIGALFVRGGVQLAPISFGAGHEFGLRPGTENVPYIVGLGKAALLAVAACEESNRKEMESLRDRMQKILQQEIGNGLTVNGAHADRLPNTLSLNFPNVSGYELLQRVPEVCASTGAACHSGESAMSATLAGIGLTPQQALGTVRLSLGRKTSIEEVDAAASLLIDAWEKLTGKN
jgi:cysteine desulfurase